MIYGLAMLLCLGAFYAFAMAKTAHYKSVFGTRPSQEQTKRFNLSGWIIILLSFIVNLSQAIGYGSLMFCGQMALSVLLIAVCLTYKPNWMRSLFYLLPLLAVIMVVSSQVF
ncbi:hypothetical protein N480_22900 [Pseudoalteromonas luteoviolacea S2607]|uniref:DUF3325 domain-containing protein n=1 Tax=Pseudoalteromonas luteoviolacea TaxID=43657 RepID=UPI0007B097D2|nr:DUF3325 domain-containing protein [Pseudoalteromonas luteoviolacea]KZN34043.1 hypothetical protein N480_22900 [Pseudoalteromonas luteoviolacea S2607]